MMNSTAFGKRQEFVAMAELIRRGFDVYATLVDDKQIDCVIRLNRPQPLYLDIQIRTRSEDVKQPATYSRLPVENPRPNYFYIFYSEHFDCYWVIPSQEIVKRTRCGRSGKNIGLFNLELANQSRKTGAWSIKPKWKDYIDNDFKRLLAY